MSSLVLQRITRDVKSSCHYSVIVDETSDRISRAEQVSLCLRYVVEGETRETFAGFFASESTEGEVLYQLVKKSITNLNLLLTDVVGECFDGAANMSGCHKGPVIIYGRGGGRRESIMQLGKIITPPLSKQNF